MAKILGLDLGSSSIGWYIREGTETKNKGVITFNAGMEKGTGGYSSPAHDRREARSKRNLIRARKYRKWKLLKVLLPEFVPLEKDELETWNKYKKGRPRRFPENKKFLKWLACDFAYLPNGKKYKNPYEIRVRGLDSKLSKHEFGRALYHLVQRRGYKNIGEKDSETKKQIDRRKTEGFNAAIKDNRTIAEALTKEFLNKDKRARNQYPYRKEYQKELEAICKAQGYDVSKNSNDEYNNKFVGKLWKAIIWQRPLRSQRGNIGKCTLEPEKPRCPISHPIYEIFRAWQFINTIKYGKIDDEKEFLSPELRQELFENVFLRKDKNFKFEKIREFIDKKLGGAKEYNYPFNKKKEIYDTTIAGMPVCKGLIDAFGDNVRQTVININKYIQPDNKELSKKIEKSIKEASKKKSSSLKEKEKKLIEKSIRNDALNNSRKIIENYSLHDLWHILFESTDQQYEKSEGKPSPF